MTEQQKIITYWLTNVALIVIIFLLVVLFFMAVLYYACPEIVRDNYANQLDYGRLILTAILIAAIIIVCVWSTIFLLVKPKASTLLHEVFV